jgi:MFS family permease
MSTRDRNTLATLFFSVFATVIGVGIVVPLLPVYAHGLGANGLTIGLLFAVFALSRTLFLPGFGRLSDRKGRKALIVPGLFAYAAISVALAWVDDVAGLIAVRFLHGIASAMLMPVIQAYVGDLAPRGREGRLLGIHGAFVLAGMSIGPMVGGLIHDHFGLRFAFLSMGALSFAGAVLCACLLPGARDERITRRREPAAWKELIRGGNLAALFGFRFTYVVCIGIIWGFLPLYGALELSLSGASIGLLITLGILASAVMNAPMGFLADRVDRRFMVIGGGLLAAYAMLSFVWAQEYRDAALASILFGVGGGISMPAVMAMAARNGSGRESMGSVMALMTVAHSLGMLAGALAGGIVMTRFQLHAVFPAGAAAMAMGIGWFVVVTLLRGARTAGERTAADRVLSVDPVAARR